jgi:hypothetical protein
MEADLSICRRLFPAPPRDLGARAERTVVGAGPRMSGMMPSEDGERRELDQRPSPINGRTHAADAEVRMPWRGLRRTYQMLTNLSDQGSWTF